MGIRKVKTMILSNLKKALFEKSEFKTPNKLATATGQTEPFTNNFVNSTKAAAAKEDVLFEALTPDRTTEEFMLIYDLLGIIDVKDLKMIHTLLSDIEESVDAATLAHAIRLIRSVKMQMIGEEQIL